jgi:flagellar hook-associated protein 2
VSNFALAFNNVTDVVVRATGQPKAGDDLAGALQFDSTARSVRNALRGKVLSVSSSRSGDVKTWGDLGITFDRNGTLQVDQAAFNKKFSASPQDAIRALSNNATTPYIYSGSASGLAGDIAVSAYGLLKTGGAVTSMVTSYSNKVDKITTEQSKLDTDMEKLTERYDKQFSALNAVLANFKSTQQRLASMLSTNQNSK